MTTRRPPLLANVNRWRSRLQLPPVAAALIDGNYKSRAPGAWLRQPERAWFFKFSGEAGLIGGRRETFPAFLQTVSFHDGRH
jgi:hypothetical protein